MQFIILGAGFDTSWLQLASEGHAPTKCLELDFAEVRMSGACTDEVGFDVAKQQELLRVTPTRYLELFSS